MTHPQCCIGRNESVGSLKKSDNLLNMQNLFNKSVKSSIPLSAGEFVMGSDHNSVILGDRETPARSVHVFDFSIALILLFLISHFAIPNFTCPIFIFDFGLRHNGKCQMSKRRLQC